MKTERLLNLVALLLHTRRPLTADEIRAKIPGYGDQSEETFHRMFERDKVDLRDLGFAVEPEEIGVLGADSGYRIRRAEALLADPGLTPDEMAALAIASQAWAGREGSLGLLKLSVGAGAGADPGSTGWVVPAVGSDRNVAALMDAIARRKVVRFTYRTGGGGAPAEREVEPHALSIRGAWYLHGYDRDRERVSVFKLTRVDGAVHVAAGKQADFDAPPPATAEVLHGPWEGAETIRARVAFDPEVAWWVERRTGARETGVRDDGWVELEMPVADPESFAAWLGGFGDHAEALAPPELREAVIAHLRAVAAGGAS